MSESAKITVNYFCLGALLIFVGSVLLCALGFTIVLPFEVTRTWPEVTCLVVNSSYNTGVCSCNEQLSVYDTCVSKYPCLQIYVAYVTSSSQDGVVDADFRLNPTTARRKRKRSGIPVKDAMSGNQSDSDLLLRIVEVLALENDSTPTVGTPSSTTIKTGSVTTSKSEDSDDSSSGVLVRSTISSTNSVQTLSTSPTGSDLNEPEVTSHVTSRPSVLPPITLTSRPNNVTTYAMLYRSWDDSFYKGCSLTECGDEIWNVKESRQFKSDWGTRGQTFTCNYNPNHRDMVILIRTSTTAAIHAIVWPGLGLLSGIILWLGLCCGCWSLKSDYANKEDSGPVY